MVINAFEIPGTSLLANVPTEKIGFILSELGNKTEITSGLKSQSRRLMKLFQRLLQDAENLQKLYLKEMKDCPNMKHGLLNHPEDKQDMYEVQVSRVEAYAKEIDD
jgi:hypothetical protein